MVSPHSLVYRFVFDNDVVARRQTIGVNDDVFIFSSFNREFKHTPSLFSVWMRILQRVPHSVLWLLRHESQAEVFYRRAASSHGVDPMRLIFTDPFPTRREEYAHKGLANLFLDAPLFNAHTTALDALWAGVPFLTVPGETVAARLGAGIAIAANMAEGVVRNMHEYEEVAVALGQQPEFAVEWQDKARARRHEAKLWDRQHWALHWNRLQLNTADAEAAGVTGYHMI
mmetsp:Transcript_24808/g.53755  ORF Transcript_24808/g.53755 Transcript_24808/m.53755 type:complete len:228 (+) Transcript_24808:45-728(+)